MKLHKTSKNMKKRFHFFSDGSFAGKVMGFGAFGSFTADGINPNPEDIFWQDYSALPDATVKSTSVSEYNGLDLIVEFLLRNDVPRKRVLIKLDSQFIVRQCQGIYGLNEFNAKGKPNVYYEKGLEVQKKIKTLGLRSKNFQWIPRRFNAYADKLSNAYKQHNEHSFSKIDVSRGRLAGILG